MVTEFDDTDPGNAVDEDAIATADSIQPIRLAAIDDHELVLSGILAQLEKTAQQVTVVALTSSVTALIDGPHADLVLLDLDLPAPDDDETVNVRRLRAWGAQVLIFTALDDQPARVRRAVASGAAGLILKSDSSQQLLDAVRTAVSGRLATSSRTAMLLLTDETLTPHLTPREREVFQLLAQGVGKNQIGHFLRPRLSEATVDGHIRSVATKYRKLGRETFNLYETLHHLVSDGHVRLERRRRP